MVCSKESEVDFSQGIMLIIGGSSPENLALPKRETFPQNKKNIFQNLAPPPPPPPPPPPHTLNFKEWG